MNYTKYPAQLHPPEKHLLHRLALDVNARFGPYTKIVNIGVRQGGSLHCLRAGAPDAVLYGIDINLKQSKFPFIGDPEAILITGDSGSPGIQAIVAPPVHLLFVDGDHEEDSVMRDILGWTPKILVGGVVAFHDYYEENLPSGFGVRTAVDKWMAVNGWESEWRHIGDCRLTIVFKRRAGGQVAESGCCNHGNL